jgi:hypothetical protein
MSEFADALRRNGEISFESMTGPIVDQHYVEALVNAFRHRPSKLDAWRIHHASPIMNFTIFYPKKGSGIRKTVFFGYGKHTGLDFSLTDTAVFASEDETLIKEYQRLFKVLKSEDISQSLSVNDPVFVQSSFYKNDVLASFKTFPDEIATRIRDCRQSIKICVAGWSQLDTHIQVIESVLAKGIAVTIALWHPKSDFIKFRSEQLSNARRIVSNNLHTLGQIRHPGDNLTIIECSGWASVSLFWIDDVIYFGLYWCGMSTLQGSFFMVKEDSPTGDRLKTEFSTMIANRWKPLKPASHDPDVPPYRS